MPPTAPLAPADRFARIIDGLCRAIAVRGAKDRLAAPLIVLIWSRLQRMAVRFGRLAARVRAGTLPPVRARRPRTASPRPRPPRRLPEGFAWLVRLVPEAASAAAQLQHLLAEPEMADLIAAAPQTGRILRPLCRMLGVRPPAGLRKPPPVAPAPPSNADPPPRPPPAPHAGPNACGPPVPASA